MKDIALYKTIHLNVSVGIHLQQYILGRKATDLYRLDLIDYDVLQFSKYVDGDLLTLQFSPNQLDDLCEAWIAHRQHYKNTADETQNSTQK